MSTTVTENFLGIEGLSKATGPANSNRLRGRLDMPSDFDSKRYVGRWVKKGPDVTKAQEKQAIPGSKGSLMAAGWAPWKHPVTKQNHTRTLSSGVYILMFRPLALQKIIQASNGNLSKERMMNEASGRTVAGQLSGDPGILPTDRLVPMLGQEEGPPLYVPMNPVETDTTRATALKTASRGTTKSK